MLEPFAEEEILLALDDTRARKRGLKVFGAGMHHDPLLSSRGKTVVNWGHNWVVLGLIICFPLWPERPFCLPILPAAVLEQTSGGKARRKYRTRPELVVEMLHLLSGHRQNRRFHAVAYGGQSVLCRLPENCELTSRPRLNARSCASWRWSAPRRWPCSSTA